MAEVKDENGRKERFYLYYDGESVAGKVNVTLHRKTGGAFFSFVLPDYILTHQGKLSTMGSRSSSLGRLSCTTTGATTTSFFRL